MPTYLQSDQSLFSLHEASRNAMLSTVEWQLVPVILFRCKDWSILVWEPKDWFPCEITHFITQYIWEGCVKSFQFIPPSRLALTCLIVSLKCRAHSQNTFTIKFWFSAKPLQLRKKCCKTNVTHSVKQDISHLILNYSENLDNLINQLQQFCLSTAGTTKIIILFYIYIILHKLLMHTHEKPQTVHTLIFSPRVTPQISEPEICPTNKCWNAYIFFLFFSKELESSILLTNISCWNFISSINFSRVDHEK